jgi:hypothetical protein
MKINSLVDTVSESAKSQLKLLSVQKQDCSKNVLEQFINNQNAN